MKHANITVDEQEWKNFLYITKAKTGKQDGSNEIRKFIARYNKRNKDILANRL